MVKKEEGIPEDKGKSRYFKFTSIFRSSAGFFVSHIFF